jgi:glutamate racemase
MKIGVFDSGVGGLSVANAIQASLPEHEILLREDKEHLPYGVRAPAEILGFITPIFEELVQAGCQVIVVACNTVSTTLIAELRQRFEVPMVAVEPMVKPAAELTESKVIAICATPTTLLSERYQYLKQSYAQGLTVLEPDCSDWALMIEDQQVDHQKINERINEVLDQGADVIALACTHYHWIEDEITELAVGKAVVLQPEVAIIEQLKQVLAQLD